MPNMLRFTGHEDTIAFLKEHGKKIGSDADKGSAEAKQVISLYEMYYRHPDNPTLGMLWGALDAWHSKVSKDSV